MNSACDQFFAGSALPSDENRGIRESHSLHVCQNATDLVRAADDFLEHGRRVNFLTQREVLFVEIGV
jgi:hypothetical protein